MDRKDFLKKIAAISALTLIDFSGIQNVLAIGETTVVNGKQAKLLSTKNYIPTAKSIIYLYLDGGSSQNDTFDPKPASGKAYSGKYLNPIQTVVGDMILGERLVNLAKISDKFSIIRSMTHNTNAHETGHYYMLTGDMTKSSIVYPSFSSLISYVKEDENRSGLFPYITLTAASTRFNEAGFLPPQYKPFDTAGEPEKGIFNVDGVVNTQMSDSRLESRRDLLNDINSSSNKIAHTSEVQKLKELQDQGFDLILGDKKDVFNLSLESDSVRQSYGMTRFGQSCLAARRLVEQGVPAVTIRYTGWDTHREHFARMDERLNDLDKALSTLILDLESRNLLDSTIIVCGGEFGRTPKVDFAPPWNGGRGHHGAAFSYLVAGGGFAGGKIVGKTDSKAEKVIERPVYPSDLIGTIYMLMGIDPHSKIKHPLEGYIPLLPSLGQEKSKGFLYELIKQQV